MGATPANSVEIARFVQLGQDPSRESDGSCDQKQPCSDGDDPDGSRDALTGRCETFGGDGCRDDSHRAQVHDPDDQEDRRQAGAA